MSGSRDLQLHIPPEPATASLPSRRRVGRRCLIVSLLCVAVIVVWQGPNMFRRISVARARAAISASQFDAARRWVERLRWEDPASSEAFRWELRLLRKEKKFDQAFESLSRAKQINPSSTDLGIEEWLLQAQAGDLSSAERPLMNALRTHADEDSEICDALVLGYLRTGQFFKAELTLKSWQADHPLESRPWVLRGVIASKIEHWSDAAGAFREALRLSPNDSETSFFLADALVMLRDFDNALPLFRRCVAALPDRVEVQLGLVRTLTNLGQFDEAIALSEGIVGRDPKLIDASQALGEALLAAGQVRRAVEVLQPAADLAPNNISLRFQLGTALRLAGRSEEAEPHLAFTRQGRLELQQRGALTRHALQFPNDLAVRVQLASLLLKYDLEEEGLMWLRGVLDSDPHHVDAHRRLAEYYRQHSARDPKFAALAEFHASRAIRTQP